MQGSVRVCNMLVAFLSFGLTAACLCVPLFMHLHLQAPHPSHRALLTNSDVLRASLELLVSGSSPLIQLGLAVVAALAAVDECIEPLTQCCAVDMVEAHAAHCCEEALREASDELLRVAADRALVAMWLKGCCNRQAA